jgi:hypothetical protein
VFLVKFTEHELYLDFHLFDLPCHHTHWIISVDLSWKS